MIKHTNNWEGVMLHHTGTSRLANINSIKKSHFDRGFGDIGYHYLIRIVGGRVFIKNGRSSEYNGAHCDVGDCNSKYLGVALIGNFSNDKLNEDEYKLLGSALRHIMNKYNVDKILAHRDVKATQCPGNNIDMEKIRNHLKI